MKSLRCHKLGEGGTGDLYVPVVYQILSGLGLRSEFSSWTYVFAIMICRSQCYWIALGFPYSTNPNKGPRPRFRNWHICLPVCHMLFCMFLVLANYHNARKCLGTRNCSHRRYRWGKQVQQAAICNIHFLVVTKNKPWSILSATKDTSDTNWSRSSGHFQ